MKSDPFCDIFLKNIEKLSKNDWELHKRLVREGVNPLDFAKVIRCDNVEKLQEISTQNKFDFNQSINSTISL